MKVAKKRAPRKKQRHDSAYKGIFSNKKSFWYFLKRYIGASWAADITLDSMEKVNKSYITREYRHLDADVIYKQKRDGQDVYFYVLLELQSAVDYTMPFRLLRYMVELLNDVFKNTPVDIRERKDFKLPAVVPIVLYNGDDNWTAARTYREYTKDNSVFGNNLIDFSYILFDLKRMDENDFVPTKDFLDIAFFADKIFDKNLTLEENIYNIFDRLVVVAPELPPNEKRKLARWMPRKFGISSDSEIESLINKTLTKGDKVIMKHAFEIMGDQMRQVGSDERAIAMAKRMLEDNDVQDSKDQVEKIVRYTGLDLNTVLKIKAGDL